MQFLIKPFLSKYQGPIKWLSIAFLIKLCLFIFFAFNFLHNWPIDLIVKKIFIISGDTSLYYEPIESFVNGNGYNTMCRMPGLLPIYAPMYFLFGLEWGKVAVILLQFFTSVVSVYCLALMAKNIFNSDKIFRITFFVYALSSFVSIYDNYGLSDSFSTSFLIFSIYFLVKTFQKNHWLPLLLSGSFLCWAIFFRPVLMVVFIISCLILIIQFLIVSKKYLLLFRSLFIFCLPLILFLSLWTIHNYNQYKMFVPLQGPFSMCFGGLPEQHLEIRKLIISFGEDSQKWSKGSGAEWFFEENINYKQNNPFSTSIYTVDFNLDSLISLKEHYDQSLNPALGKDKQEAYKKMVMHSSNSFYLSYRKHHPIGAFIINPIQLILKFIFPKRLDNLPFPNFSEMKLYHKIIKLGYLILLNLISLLGIIGIVLALIKKQNLALFYGLIPISLIITLAGLLGFIEQRYLVPAYPFLVIFSAYTLNWILTYFDKARQAR